MHHITGMQMSQSVQNTLENIGGSQIESQLHAPGTKCAEDLEKVGFPVRGRVQTDLVLEQVHMLYEHPLLPHLVSNQVQHKAQCWDGGAI